MAVVEGLKVNVVGRRAVKKRVRGCAAVLEAWGEDVGNEVRECGGARMWKVG